MNIYFLILLDCVETIGFIYPDFHVAQENIFRIGVHYDSIIFIIFLIIPHSQRIIITYALFVSTFISHNGCFIGHDASAKFGMILVLDSWLLVVIIEKFFLICSNN